MLLIVSICNNFQGGFILLEIATNGRDNNRHRNLSKFS